MNLKQKVNPAKNTRNKKRKLELFGIIALLFAIVAMANSDDALSLITNSSNFTANASGQPAISSFVTFVAGNNTTLTQSGNNITIDSTGGSGSPCSDCPNSSIPSLQANDTAINQSKVNKSGDNITGLLNISYQQNGIVAMKIKHPSAPFPMMIMAGVRNNFLFNDNWNETNVKDNLSYSTMAFGLFPNPTTGLPYFGVFQQPQGVAANYLSCPPTANGGCVMSIDNQSRMDLYGDFKIVTAGKGIAVKEGTNAKQGTAVCSAGSVTVNNTNVSSSSRIFVTVQNATGANDNAQVGGISAGVGFTIYCDTVASNRLVAYEIFEPS